MESASEAPLGQLSKRLGRRAPATGVGREDVAELGLVRLLVDSHRDRDPEERAVLGVDDREAFSGSFLAPELVGLQPGPPEIGRGWGRDKRVSLDIGVLGERVEPVDVLG